MKLPFDQFDGPDGVQYVRFICDQARKGPLRLRTLVRIHVLGHGGGCVFIDAVRAAIIFFFCRDLLAAPERTASLVSIVVFLTYTVETIVYMGGWVDHLRARILKEFGK